VFPLVKALQTDRNAESRSKFLSELLVRLVQERTLRRAEHGSSMFRVLQVVQRAKTNWSLALVLLADAGVDPPTGRVLDLLLIEHHQNHCRQQTSCRGRNPSDDRQTGVIYLLNS